MFSVKLAIKPRTSSTHTTTNDPEKLTEAKKATFTMEKNPADCREQTLSLRRAKGVRKPGACRQCPCCPDDQVPKPKRQRSQSNSRRPLKRKRTRPSKSSVAQPEVLNRPSSPQPATVPLQHNSPVIIHNHSTEEYQRIYHEVVDNMLTYKSGHPRPYTLELGRRIKQKLWERLDRPMMSSTVNEDGSMNVDVSYGGGAHPPLYDEGTLGEPKPGKPKTF